MDCSSMPHLRELSPGVFRQVKDIVYESSGIHLKEGKEALVAARLAKRLRVLGLPTLRAYLRFVETDSSGQELTHLVDAIATNYTRFFREPDHFAYLRRWLEERAADGQRRFRLWCAAASSGEEPYSIAMTLIDTVQAYGLDLKVLATDISTKTLRVAMRGVYGDKVIEAVPPGDRHRFFVRHRRSDDDDQTWEVRPEVRSLLVFDQVNLAKPPFPMKGPFDMVFCRTVLIYFDAKVRAGLIEAIDGLVRSGGVLVIGHSETLAGIKSGFKLIHPSVYAKQ